VEIGGFYYDVDRRSAPAMWEWGHGRVKWPNEMQFLSTFVSLGHVTWHWLIADFVASASAPASHKSLTLRCINVFVRQCRGKTVVKSQMVHVEHPQSINKNSNGSNREKPSHQNQRPSRLPQKRKKTEKKLDFVAKVKVFLLARCNYIVNDFIIYLLN